MYSSCVCGRYALHAHPDVVALQFGLDSEPQLQPRYNVCPGTEVLIVRANRAGRRVADQYRWGLIPGWAKDSSIGNKLANARGETLAEKPAFRNAFRQWRCLVPASGFYEWKTVAGSRHPWYLRPAGAGLFGLAGITELWNGIHTVSLITTSANELLSGIHDRMPVILQPHDYAAWLDRSNRDAHALLSLVRPYPADRMQAYPVSLRVNTPEHDDAGLIDELQSGPFQPGLHLPGR